VKWVLLWRLISGAGEAGHVEECEWVLHVSFGEDHLILIFSCAEKKK